MHSGPTNSKFLKGVKMPWLWLFTLLLVSSAFASIVLDNNGKNILSVTEVTLPSSPLEVANKEYVDQSVEAAKIVTMPFPSLPFTVHATNITNPTSRQEITSFPPVAAGFTRRIYLGNLDSSAGSSHMVALYLGGSNPVIFSRHHDAGVGVESTPKEVYAIAIDTKSSLNRDFETGTQAVTTSNVEMTYADSPLPFLPYTMLQAICSSYLDPYTSTRAYTLTTRRSVVLQSYGESGSRASGDCNYLALFPVTPYHPKVFQYGEAVLNTVTFPVPFDSIPAVHCTLAHGSALRSISENGFTFIIHHQGQIRVNQETQVIHWMAVAPTV